MSERDFDLDSLTVPEEVVKVRLKAAAELEGKKPTRRQRSTAGFVKFPLAWVKRLGIARHVATYQLAIFLQYQNWKRPGEPITVSNVALRDWGIICRREQKREGLRELEKLELISVECKGKASPIAKLLL